MENYRRQGHGEALLEAAIKKCRTRTVLPLTLHVDPLRTPALNLYKKFGFRVDTLIQGYYSVSFCNYCVSLILIEFGMNFQTVHLILFIF